MTDKELKDLVASLAVSQALTDKQMKETDKQVKETSKQMKETDKQMKETIKSFSYLKENVDGISKTTGQEAQEFFYTSFKKNKKINNIEFDSISSNLGVAKNGKKHEIDIFLENGNSVGIIEVKNKVKEKDLEQLQKIVDNFYYFHPSFKEYKIIPAIAGKIFPEHLQHKALKRGFVVVTQVGNHTEQIAPT